MTKRKSKMISKPFLELMHLNFTKLKNITQEQRARYELSLQNPTTSKFNKHAQITAPVMELVPEVFIEGD